MSKSKPNPFAGLLTIGDAANLVGVKHQSLRRAIDRGTCPHVLVAGMKLVYRKDVLKWGKKKDTLAGRPVTDS